MERQRGLDQACGPRRGLRVADLRLHRAQGAPSPFGVRLAINFGQRLQFRRVADLRPGSVRLDELDRVGGRAGDLVGVLQRPRLADGARGVDGVPFAVARRADRLDHRVNRVAVAPGVVKPLQGQHSQTFAQDRAVATGVERSGVSRRGERRRLAEAHVHEYVVERVEPAGEGEVTAPRREFEEREVDRADGAGAGGVDHAIRPAQVQPVGDPSRGDVAEQTRKRILLPSDVRVGDPLDDLFRLRFGDARGLQRPSPDRVAESRTERDHEFERAGDAEDHAHAAAVEWLRRPFAVAGVFKGLTRDHQAQELGRVGGVEVIRGDPEIKRREIDWGEEAAAAGVGTVGCFGVGVEVVFGPPVRFGHIPDRVHPVADVRPEAGEVLRLGKKAAHSNDRHRHRVRGVSRIQVSSPCSSSIRRCDVFRGGSISCVTIRAEGLPFRGSPKPPAGGGEGPRGEASLPGPIGNAPAPARRPHREY